MSRARTSFIAASLLSLALVGCDREAPQPADEPAAVDAGVALEGTEQSVELLNLLPTCDVYHRGAFVDVAEESAAIRRDFAVGPFLDTRAADRDGTRVARIDGQRVSYGFWLDAELEHPFVELRGAAGSVSRVGVYLNDRYLATLTLPRGVDRVRTRELTEALPPGRHVVSLNLRGKTTSQGRADLDWIRLAGGDDVKATFTPLRERDIVKDVAIDGQPKRSLALPAPSAARCPLWVPQGARFKVNLGFWGAGKGDAELRLLQDGKQPLVLQRRKLSGGPGVSWIPVQVDLSDHAQRLVAIELRAASGEGGGRVVFGEPKLELTHPPGPRATPAADTVILVVLSGVERRRLPPFVPPRSLPGLAALMRGGVTFTSYRTPTTVSGPVMASLLTGLAPRAHGFEDPNGKLPSSVRTVAEVFKLASGRTAMFTGVPTSFAAFGFDRGWDRYDAISPVQDVPASEPTARATEWLDRQLGTPGQRLVVIHQRGGHPPWDLDTEETGALPPQEYGGLLRPRRGAILLNEVRQRRRAQTRRIAPEDWVRLHAFHDAALAKQDAELVRLFAMLRKRDAYERALIVVVGDVPLGDPPDVPYAPAPPLREDRLLAPLYVKFPDGALAGTQSTLPTTAMDVAHTMLTALGLSTEGRPGGTDLFLTATGAEPVLGRPLQATLGNTYTSRWGLLLLTGTMGRRPSLCELDVDPACISDAFLSRPIAARALWRATYRLEQQARESVPQSELVELDQDTSSALTVWGY